MEYNAQNLSRLKFLRKKKEEKLTGATDVQTYHPQPAPTAPDPSGSSRTNQRAISYLNNKRARSREWWKTCIYMIFFEASEASFKKFIYMDFFERAQRVKKIHTYDNFHMYEFFERAKRVKKFMYMNFWSEWKNYILDLWNPQTAPTTPDPSDPRNPEAISYLKLANARAKEWAKVGRRANLTLAVSDLQRERSELCAERSEAIFTHS